MRIKTKPLYFLISINTLLLRVQLLEANFGEKKSVVRREVFVPRAFTAFQVMRISWFVISNEQ